ncbi:MAG: hypothetical protein CVU38_18930 [Chloroflexi bacterium HGW-Chloroflexi-1]|nr:MAG: hypothetical protein CVU38_18930 [Chloroflexi bacterium HGW-Chloroflexi-1]
MYAAQSIIPTTLSACRRCADAGYFIGSTPICTLNAGATFVAVGQAPGRHEAEVMHRPFSGPAGKWLFRWLAQAGFDEAELRAALAVQGMPVAISNHAGTYVLHRSRKILRFDIIQT